MSHEAEKPNAPRELDREQTLREFAAEPLEPGDAYMENGFLVFTTAYHLRRGYCCNSDCRHCPYK